MTRLGFWASRVAAVVIMALSSFGASAADRPRVALVLSGGGARGAAHVGVLRVLEERRVPVDLVVGTSMGAIVGGLYASGMSPDDIERQMTHVDWGRAFSDRADRRTQAFRRKQDDHDHLVRFRIGLDGLTPRFPLGALEGRRVLALLRTMTVPVAGVRSFDELAIPFRAVAADLETGNKVVLDSGELALAMRASMSIPAVFEPVEIDGRLLIDGGIAENLAVSVARDLGAERIIAVDIGTPLLDRDEIADALGVVDQTLTILIRRQADAQAASLSDGDLLLTPQLDTITSSGFGQAAEAIRIGEETARAAVAEIDRMAVSAEVWAARRRQRSLPPAEVPRVGQVVVESSVPIHSSVVTGRLETRPGQRLDVEKVIADLERLFGLGLFHNVDFHLDPGDGGTDLRIVLDPRERGRDSLRIGLRLTDDFDGDTSFDLGVRYSRLQLNSRGGEARVDLRIGEHQRALVELYQPLGARGMFVSFEGGFEAEDLAIVGDGVELVAYRNRGWQGQVSVGRELGNWGEVRFDLASRDARGELTSGLFFDRTVDLDESSARLRFEVDSLDDLRFPGHGWRSRLMATHWFDTPFGEEDGTGLELTFERAGTRGRWRWGAATDLGWTVDDEPDLLPFRLGGMFRLSGLNEDELFGRHLGLVALRGYRLLGGAGIRMPVYVGASLEAGGLWATEQQIALDTVQLGGSVFLGVDSILGPVFLGWGWTEGGRDNVFFSLGRDF